MGEINTPAAFKGYGVKTIYRMQTFTKGILTENFGIVCIENRVQIFPKIYSFFSLDKPCAYENVDEDLFITFGVIMNTDKQANANKNITSRWRY